MRGDNNCDIMMDALILAGGENKRLPFVKGFIEIKSRRIIEFHINLLDTIFDRIMISTNNPELFFYLGVPMVGDVMKSRGPMTGILSGLVASEAPEIFVIACDMPFINAELIRYIVDKYKAAEHQINPPLPPFTKGGRGGIKRWDVAVPVYDKKPQPLFGIYSKKTAQTMEKNINQGKRSLRGFLSGLDVLYIEEEEVRAVDPDGRSFVNINTIEDYKREILAVSNEQIALRS
jgi:molybdopterin-guanine dinucleotide biosynthesis protein A